MKPFAVGVDLGGTKTEVVVVRRVDDPGARGERLDVLGRTRVPTERERGYGAVLETVAAAIEGAARDAGVDLSDAFVGVGMPGAVTRRGGLIKNSNTVCLNGQPFHADLTRRLHHPIVFENDANCFALAEAVLGAGRAYREGLVFGVILGTGVGGGVIFGGKVWRGPQGLGGEWGHHAVGPWRTRPRSGEPTPGTTDVVRGLGLRERPVCYCGNTGCLELYASGVAIEREYEERTGVKKKLADIARCRDVDEAARAALDEMLEAFGRGLANVINILDPSAIVLGGGVSNLDILYTEGVAHVARYVLNDELLSPILKNELGDSAGVFGAALLEGIR